MFKHAGNMNKNLTVALIFLVIISVAGVLMLSFFGTSGTQKNDEGGGVFSSLFPFLTNPITGTNIDDAPSIEESGPVPRLRLVTNVPVAGGTFSETGHIRYVERETGHIYQTPVDSQTSVRISNTTIPGIQEVIWVNDNRIILRYLDGETIESFSGFLASSTPDQTLSGTFLPEARYMLHASKDNILLLSKTSAGSRLDVANADGNAPRTLFSSPISSWVPAVSGSEIFLTSAPTYLANGDLFTLTGTAFQRIFGGLPGLMTLPDTDGRYIAFSTSAEDRGAFGVYDRETKEIIPLPAETFAAKCAWIPTEAPALFCGVPLMLTGAAALDDWLIGSVSFEDRAWLLYPESRTAEIILSLTDAARAPIDVINPIASADGRHVLFINKNDSSLWSLTLNPNQ